MMKLIVVAVVCLVASSMAVPMGGLGMYGAGLGMYGGLGMMGAGYGMGMYNPLMGAGMYGMGYPMMAASMYNPIYSMYPGMMGGLGMAGMYPGMMGGLGAMYGMGMGQQNTMTPVGKELFLLK
ncbi:hypothetical protein SNE40_004196 [Patella caerulea]|uniref:Uncharacterized protein n=1 Tax=Patella caerulea TaxID=87958 RepID=A0AAN8Q9H3_PATCE